LCSPSNGFRYVNNIAKKTISVKAFLIKQGYYRKYLGIIDVFYSDQSPNGKSLEAQIVRSGIWKSSEVGWLWTIIDEKTYWLAKITPKERTILHKGWIDATDEIFFIKEKL